MIPKADGDATPLGQRPLSVLPVVHRIWAFAGMVQRTGFGLGFQFRSSVLMRSWYTTALDVEEVRAGRVDSDVHLFVADVVKSFDTVDRSILDRVLSSLGLSDWFRHAYLPWCKYLAAQVGVEPQLYADNLKCVSRDPDVLLRLVMFGWSVRSLHLVSVSFWTRLGRSGRI